jgi:hypothetical protein
MSVLMTLMGEVGVKEDMVEEDMIAVGRPNS